MNDMLPHASDARPNVGRTVHPVIAHLDGHIEQICAETDDAIFFERGAEAEAAVAHAIERCELIIAQASTLADLSEATNLLRHVAHIAHRLAKEQHGRARRLTDVIIPEVQRCYKYAEEKYGGLVHA